MSKVKFILATLATLATSGVWAQSTLPTEYTLKVKAVELDKIGKALGKLPYEEVVELIQNLRQQVIEQQQPKPVEKSNDPS